MAFMVLAVIIITTNNGKNNKKSNESNKELKYGTYNTQDDMEVIELYEDGQFVLNSIRNTAWISKGKYIVDDDRLILYDKTAGEYEFIIGDKDTLIYEKGNEDTDKIIKQGTQYHLTELREKGEKIEWSYDLTGDGTNEKILVNVDSVKDDVTNTIEVYSGKTGELIWNMHLSSVHADRYSVSLYEMEGKSYILTWDPAMWQGSSVFRYRILSLTEEGEEIELETNEIVFDVYYCEEEDIKKVIEFSYEVNSKFKDSFLLASTVNAMIYSTTDNIENEYFSTESLIGTMVTNLYINRNLS